MFKYFHIIKFLMTHDLTLSKKYWEVEFLKKEFKWFRLLKKLKKRANNYMFWYRLAYFMYRYGNWKQRKIALKINEILNVKYSIDIPIKATIGIGLNIWHFSSIVITERAIIGKNFKMASNVVIGFKNYSNNGHIKIGDNVMLSTGSVIFGQNITIGSNVNIGAMTFINKDIPDNCTVYTEKTNKIILKAH